MLNTFNFNKIKILNYLISLIPLAIIIGNTAINSNIILICIIGLLIYKKEIFIIEEKIYKYLLFLFFLYLIFITLINNWSSLALENTYKDNLFKSFFYSRFLIFFLIINKLIEKNSFNIKLFFYSCAFFSALVSLDIVIQFFLKKNVFGYNITKNRPSSFFGEENVAGSFLQKFLLFLFYLIVTKKNLFRNNIFSLVLLIFFSIIIMLTSNRMPFFVFIMSIFLLFLIEKKFKQILFLVLIFLISSILFLNYTENKSRFVIEYKVFYYNTVEILTKAPKLFINNESETIKFGQTGYLAHFNSGVQIWKKNKIFGHGLKSFKLNCEYGNNQTCNTHPHNYFLELMVDTGMIGLIIIYTIFFLGSKNFIKHYYKKNNFRNNKFSALFFILIVMEFFPFRSTGSFFTTGNSIFIFLIMVIFLNIKKLKNYKI